MRNHERLFDKKIVNRKRFSQVVMCDEDEIFRLNEEIPPPQLTGNNNNSLKSKNSDNNTLKYHPETAEQQNDSVQTDSNSYQARLMDHVLEEEEEGECFGEEDEEDDEEEEDEDSSDQFRRRRKGHSGKHHHLMNHSNLSTMATNSECANVGSIREDVDVDEDSFRSSDKVPQIPQHRGQQKVAPANLSSKLATPTDREGIGVLDDAGNGDDVEEEDDDEV